jgi:hypothetical protein
MPRTFLGGVTTPSRATEPATRRYVDDAADVYLPIATGTHFNGNGGAASTALIQTRCRQSRKMLRVISPGATELQLEWANIYTSVTPQAGDASCELPSPNTVTVRMSVEYPAGKMRIVSGSSAWSSVTAYAVADQVTSGGFKWVAIQAGTNQTPAAASAYWRKVNTYPVQWDGQTDTAGTIPFAPGAYKRSLPVPLLEAVQYGDLIAVLGAFDSGATSGTYIPYAGANGASNHGTFVDWVVDAAGGMPAIGSALPDTGVTNQTNGNTTVADAPNNANWLQIPYATAVTGNSQDKRCVALFGDSLIQGSGGDNRDGEPCGIFPRALDGARWWRVAQGGNRAQCYVPGNHPWQASVLARCSAIVSNMGLNDISTGATLATAQAYIQRMWKAAAASGAPLYHGLLSPISASSDAWATVANQSRFTNGGTIATTQYPTDDATFLTSVYGLVSMWISQDAGLMNTPDNVAVKAGQKDHPVRAILDWHGLIADGATSWKWNAPGYTSDGAHPNTIASQAQAAYLAPQMEPVLIGRTLPFQWTPAWSPTGEVPLMPFPRSMCKDLSPVATGSQEGVLGTSPGRYYYGVRLMAGTAAGSRSYTILAGADQAKLKVIHSGVLASVASDIYTLSFPGAPLWIPYGHLVVAVVTTPAGSSWAGALASAAPVHVTGALALLAGSSAATAVLTGVQSIVKGVTFGTGITHRLWGEVY